MSSSWAHWDRPHSIPAKHKVLFQKVKSFCLRGCKRQRQKKGKAHSKKCKYRRKQKNKIHCLHKFNIETGNKAGDHLTDSAVWRSEVSMRSRWHGCQNSRWRAYCLQWVPCRGHSLSFFFSKQTDARGTVCKMRDNTIPWMTAMSLQVQESY